MENLIKEIYTITNKFREVLKTTNHVFLTQEEIDDWDIIWDMPRLYNVDKHSYYDEYVIVSIVNGVINTIGISEGDSGEEKVFDLDYLSTDELIMIIENLN